MLRRRAPARHHLLSPSSETLWLHLRNLAAHHHALLHFRRRGPAVHHALLLRHHLLLPHHHHLLLLLLGAALLELLALWHPAPGKMSKRIMISATCTHASHSGILGILGNFELRHNVVC